MLHGNEDQCNMDLMIDVIWTWW